jgi:uncharacterized protein (TIGR03086 family)
VTLVHEGLNAEQEIAHGEGWTHYFERLEKVAATGDAGQDEWAWAPDPIDPLVAAEACLSAIQPVLRGLTSEDKPKATPCDDFTCHELAEHLMGGLVQLGQMAGATLTIPDGISLEGKVSSLVDQNVQAWLAYDDEMTVDGRLPSSMAQAIISLELLLHGWDLAQALGQQMRVSDELVAYVSSIVTPIITGGRDRGSFKAEVEAEAGAGALDRLAAFAGRTPVAVA